MDGPAYKYQAIRIAFNRRGQRIVTFRVPRAIPRPLIMPQLSGRGIPADRCLFLLALLEPGGTRTHHYRRGPRQAAAGSGLRRTTNVERQICLRSARQRYAYSLSQRPASVCIAHAHVRAEPAAHGYRPRVVHVRKYKEKRRNILPAEPRDGTKAGNGAFSFYRGIKVVISCIRGVP